jgi:hypothetical protein
VKDPIEPEDWCKKFNASLVKPLKTLKLTSRLTTMAAWIMGVNGEAFRRKGRPVAANCA